MRAPRNRGGGSGWRWSKGSKTPALFLLLIALVCTPLLAEKYSQTLLAMHARVMPSIILMDREIARKVPPGELTIIVFHEPSDERPAGQFAALLENAYPDGIGGYRIKARTLPYGAETEALQPAGFYLFPASAAQIRRAVALGIESQRVTFAHEESDVAQGALASLSVGRKTVPYLNTDTVTKSKILFSPTLIGIARRYPE